MRTLHRRFLGTAILAPLAILAATTVALGQDGEEIIVSDTLAPKRLEVAAGTVVTWRNADSERHRVRSRQGPVEFDSGNLEPGERFSVTFVVAGEYPYRDERNDEDPAYFGTVVVIDERPSGGPPPMQATVTLIDESYQPAALEVAVGATVTWRNVDGDDDHTVTSTDGAFDSGVLPAGSDFEHTFDVPGTYPFVCAIHPEMEGTITVVGDGPAPTGDVVAESPSPAETSATVGEPPADDATTPDDPAVVTEVAVVDVAFVPAAIEIPAGTTVDWTNEDPFAHTVTARDGTFDSERIDAGQVFSETFAEPGTYDYFCAIHPSMTGTVTVTP